MDYSSLLSPHVLVPSGRGRGSADVRATGADVVEFANSRTGVRSQVLRRGLRVGRLLDLEV